MLICCLYLQLTVQCWILECFFVQIYLGKKYCFIAVGRFYRKCTHRGLGTSPRERKIFPEHSGDPEIAAWQEFHHKYRCSFTKTEPLKKTIIKKNNLSTSSARFPLCSYNSLCIKISCHYKYPEYKQAASRALDSWHHGQLSGGLEALERDAGERRALRFRIAIWQKSEWIVLSNRVALFTRRPPSTLDKNLAPTLWLSTSLAVCIYMLSTACV